MLWWLLILGSLLLLFGVFIKYKEYEDYGDYKDFQNLTTKKRYIKLDDSDNKNNINANKDNNKNLDLAMKDAEEKEKKLAKINDNLDKIIQEITEKEEKIQKSLAKLEDNDIKDKTNTDFKKIFNTKTQKIDKNSLSERDQKILNLAEKGLEKEEIADELNIGIRETALILRMHKRGVVND